MNVRIIAKNHAADPEKEFHTKSSLKLYGHGYTASVGVKIRKIRSKIILMN